MSVYCISWQVYSIVAKPKVVLLQRRLLVQQGGSLKPTEPSPCVRGSFEPTEPPPLRTGLVCVYCVHVSVVALVYDTVSNHLSYVLCLIKRYLCHCFVYM